MGNPLANLFPSPLSNLPSSLEAAAKQQQQRFPSVPSSVPNPVPSSLFNSNNNNNDLSASKLGTLLSQGSANAFKDGSIFANGGAGGLFGAANGGIPTVLETLLGKSQV